MGKLPSSKLADQYQTYPTASAAAVAALRGITNKTWERGGGVLYNKEQNVYAATDPVGADDGTHFAASVGVPKGWVLHSTYHTHPAGALSTQFSEDDIDTAKQLKAPSYVLARADNKVRMFDPSSSKVQSSSDPTRFGTPGTKFSNGSLVDETPPKTPDAAATPAPAAAFPAAAAAPAPAAAAPAPAAAVPVDGSRITMKDFVNRHRAQTTKYKHTVVHIKSGAPKRP